MFVLRTLTMNPSIHPRFKPLIFIVETLEQAARELAVAGRRRVTGLKPRARRGATLRPSVETPLWNAVVVAVKPHLRHRGDRALLAHELGVHRARIHEFFDQKSAMPDAERALQLLIWLANRERMQTGKKA
jgi:hypothetical protein